MKPVNGWLPELEKSSGYIITPFLAYFSKISHIYLCQVLLTFKEHKVCVLTTFIRYVECF